jgi:hypothetical protein
MNRKSMLTIAMAVAELAVCGAKDGIVKKFRA